MANAMGKFWTHFLTGSKTFAKRMTEIVPNPSAPQNTKVLPRNLLHPPGSVVVGRQTENKYGLPTSLLCHKQTSCTPTSALPLGNLKKEMVRFLSDSKSPEEGSSPRDLKIPCSDSEPGLLHRTIQRIKMADRKYRGYIVVHVSLSVAWFVSFYLISISYDIPAILGSLPDLPDWIPNWISKWIVYIKSDTRNLGVTIALYAVFKPIRFMATFIVVYCLKKFGYIAKVVKKK